MEKPKLIDNSEQNHLIVVGGGITGLAIAYIASKAGRKVTVLEGSSNFGGLLNTFPVGGNELERFYHHFFTHDAEINWLIKDLGIEDKLVYRKTKMGVFHAGKIYDFSTPKDLLSFSPLGWIDKVRFGLTSLYLGKLANWRKNEHVSALDWFNKYAGKKVTSVIWEPMLNVKFGKYAKEVPLAWMIGRLKQRMGSRKNGDEQLGYLDGSLKTLLDALLAALRKNGVELINNMPVGDVVIEDNHITGVMGGKSAIGGNQVVLTIPSVYLVHTFSKVNGFKHLNLGSIKYFGAVCVVLELTHSISDAYWMNVTDKNLPFGGIIEHTNLIGPEHYGNRHIAYLSKYFDSTDAIALMSDDEIKDLMISKLPEINPAFSKDWIIQAHVFKTNTAATVCDLEFSRKVVHSKLPIDGLYLANMMHIYPDERSVNNSIRVAAEACRVMGINSDFVPKGSSLSGQIGFNQ